MPQGTVKKVVNAVKKKTVWRNNRPISELLQSPTTWTEAEKDQMKNLSEKKKSIPGNIQRMINVERGLALKQSEGTAVIPRKKSDFKGQDFVANPVSNLVTVEEQSKKRNTGFVFGFSQAKGL